MQGEGGALALLCLGAVSKLRHPRMFATLEGKQLRASSAKLPPVKLQQCRLATAAIYRIQVCGLNGLKFRIDLRVTATLRWIGLRWEQPARKGPVLGVENCSKTLLWTRSLHSTTCSNSFKQYLSEFFLHPMQHFRSRQLLLARKFFACTLVECVASSSAMFPRPVAV